MINQFVVFVQQMKEPSKVISVYGPYKSWDKANKICSKVRLENDDNDYWIGIRMLNKHIPPSK